MKVRRDGAQISDAFGQTASSISLPVLTKDIGARRLQIPRRYRQQIADDLGIEDRPELGQRHDYLRVLGSKIGDERSAGIGL